MSSSLKSPSMQSILLISVFILHQITYLDSLSISGHHAVSRKLHDSKHQIKMGVSDSTCDDAVTGTEIDWDESPVNYTCYTPKEPLPSFWVSPEPWCVQVTEDAKHKCMFEKIEYNETIPTYGNHRPLWPVYGEYTFVPPQRWIHSLEHGAVVMLYHPCTHPQRVAFLRSLVTTCIRKHIITPSTLVPREKPLALITWGCKLLMNQIDEHSVIHFIKNTAMKAPEAHVHADGQYTKYLINQARPVFGSDGRDSNLCPLAS